MAVQRARVDACWALGQIARTPSLYCINVIELMILSRDIPLSGANQLYMQFKTTYTSEVFAIDKRESGNELEMRVKSLSVVNKSMNHVKIYEILDHDELLEAHFPEMKLS